MPACTYKVSAEIRKALAICCRISADGRRRPRSIWLRYGLEIPASSDSRRRESRAVDRCSRMNAPRSLQRSGSCLGTRALLARSTRWSGQQAVDRRLAGLVPADDLGLERVDA